MSNTSKGKGRAAVAGRGLLALAGVLFAGVVLTFAGCGSGGNPSVGDILDNPGLYLGNQYVIPGEASKIYHPQVFSMDENRPFDSNILVFTKSSIQNKIRENSKIDVTAVVRTFNLPAIEREIDFNFPTEVDDQLRQDFSGKPVLVASSVFVKNF